MYSNTMGGSMMGNIISSNTMGGNMMSEQQMLQKELAHASAHRLEAERTNRMERIEAERHRLEAERINRMERIETERDYRMRENMARAMMGLPPLP